MSDESPAQVAYRRSRQKLTIFGLAAFLVVAGLLLIFVLKRVPLPLRIIAGLGDFVAGLVILTLARQKFSEKP